MLRSFRQRETRADETGRNLNDQRAARVWPGDRDRLLVLLIRHLDGLPQCDVIRTVQYTFAGADGNAANHECPVIVLAWLGDTGFAASKEPLGIVFRER